MLFTYKRCVIGSRLVNTTTFIVTSLLQQVLFIKIKLKKVNKKYSKVPFLTTRTINLSMKT